MSNSTLYSNNPQINPDCSNIYVGEVLCVDTNTFAYPEYNQTLYDVRFGLQEFADFRLMSARTDAGVHLPPLLRLILSNRRPPLSSAIPLRNRTQHLTISS